MSALFSVLGISGSGVNAMQTWLDTSAGNVANANDTVAANKTTWAPESTVLSPTGPVFPGQTGVGVTATVQLGSNKGVLAYEPNNPLANNRGEVRVANVSLSSQLVNLLQAQDGYEANTSVLQKAVAAYKSGLTIGS